MSFVKTVAQLRSTTNLPITQCVEAAEQAGGDYDRALTILQESSRNVEAKKLDRLTVEGVIDCYVHFNGKVAAMVELECETDFVAKNEEFRQLARDIAMHVVVARPIWVCAKKDDGFEDTAAEVGWKNHLGKVKEEFSDKPEQIREKIALGKMGKWLSEVSLVHQPFAKDEDKTVGDLINEAISKFGENIKVRRFVVFDVKE